MNPWDLSCRSKLGGEPSTGEQLHGNRPPSSVIPIAGTELRLDRSGAAAVSGNGTACPSINNGRAVINTTGAIVHLTAFTNATDGALSQSSSTNNTVPSMCIASSLSSSPPFSSSPSSSPADSLPSSASSSQFPSPASTRSNSIETSEEIQLVQRVALLSEHAPLASDGLRRAHQDIKQASDQLHNISNESNINCNTASTDTSSSSSVASRGGNSSSSSGSLLLQDRKARKKDQNRRAAYNYRRKKMEEKNRMREEEMRLVYSRVCLIGYLEELESSIMYILNTKTRKILDKDGNSICFLCPICLQSCDNILNLRSHLHETHYENSDVSKNKSC